MHGWSIRRVVQIHVSTVCVHSKTNTAYSLNTQGVEFFSKNFYRLFNLIRSSLKIDPMKGVSGIFLTFPFEKNSPFRCILKNQKKKDNRSRKKNFTFYPSLEIYRRGSDRDENKVKLNSFLFTATSTRIRLQSIPISLVYTIEQFHFASPPTSSLSSLDASS